MIVMFDLPVSTRRQRKDAGKFRLSLLDIGFLKCQFSVYAKFCTSKEQVRSVARQIRCFLAPHGSVDILTITDTQFKNIICYQERRNVGEKLQVKQLELF